MIIACPHCQTKYQVTYEAIGSAGRKVQCAHCQQAWQQAPLSEPLPSAKEQKDLDAFTEDRLDEAMRAEEEAAATELAKRVADEETHQKSVSAAKVDPALVRSRQRAFSKRQDAIAASQPMAQMRRAIRIGLALLLCAVVAGSYFVRKDIVARYPAMAGVYEAIGLGVNVAGLEFSNVAAQRSLHNGKDVLVVSAQIVGLDTTPTTVPPVVVTLLDDHGQSIYAWSIAPSIDDLMAGERATFDTQLVMPPGDAERLRLSFAEAAPVSAALTLSGEAIPLRPKGSVHAQISGAAPASHPPQADEHSGAAAIHGEPAAAHAEPPEAAAEHAAPHSTDTQEHH
jgi:predicted Zn finger-like uncharacterized protein